MKSIEQIEQETADNKHDLCEKIDLHLSTMKITHAIKKYKISQATIGNIKHFDKRLNIETLINIHKKIFTNGVNK